MMLSNAEKSDLTNARAVKFRVKVTVVSTRMCEKLGVEWIL